MDTATGRKFSFALLLMFSFCSLAAARSKRAGETDQAACKPGSVSATAVAQDGHSSGTPVAGRLARPTRTTGSETACPANGAVVPTWSCSRWGLPCRRRCRRRGALLPHPFTLTRRHQMSGAPAGGLLSVALSLGSPPPGITRHRVSVEPGLSSPGRAPAGAARERPSGRLIRSECRVERCAVQACTRIQSSASRPSRRASVAGSATPSTRCGRKWRWKAMITSSVARSILPCRGTG